MKGCFTTLLLAFVFAIFAAFFGRSCQREGVEQILTQRVEKEIEQAYPGLDVKYDHLTAIVKGNASESQRNEIKKRVKELALGNGRVHFTESEGSLPVATVPSQFTIFRDQGTLTLVGNVNAEQTKAQLQANALKRVAGLTVANQLQVDQETLPFPAFGAAVEAVPILMNASENGRIEAKDGKVIVSGNVDSREIKEHLMTYFEPVDWPGLEVVDQIQVKPPKPTIPPSFSILRNKGKLTLTGMVDSSETREKIGNAAKIEGLILDDQIEVSRKVIPFPSASLDSALTGVPNLLSASDAGKVTVNPEKIVLNGLVESRAAKREILGLYNSGEWKGPKLEDQIEIRRSIPSNFAIARDDKRLVLTGKVDRPRTKQLIGDAVKLPGLTLENQIKVDEEVLAFPDLDNVVGGLPSILQSTKSGKIDVTPAQVSFDGEVENNKARDGLLTLIRNWTGPKFATPSIKVATPPKPSNFSIARNDNKVTLTGLVDSQQTKNLIGSAAKGEGITIENQIKIDDSAMAFPEIGSIMAGLPDLLKTTRQGKFDFTPDKVVLNGAVQDENAKQALRDFFNRPDWKGPEMAGLDQIKIAPPAKPMAPLDPSNFTIEKQNNKLVVTGVVDSPETREMIGNAVKLEGLTIDNQIKVNPSRKPFADLGPVAAGIPTLLKAAENGKIAVTPDQVTLDGMVKNEDAKKEVMNLFKGEGWAGTKVVDQIKVGVPKTGPSFAWKQDTPKKAVLTGTVPDQQIRNALVDAAKKRLGSKGEVVDRLKISENVTEAPWLKAVPVFVTKAMPQVTDPSININDKSATISGTVPSSTILNDVSVAFSGIKPPGKLDINLKIVQPSAPTPPPAPMRNKVPVVELTGKGNQLTLSGQVPNKATHDSIVNTILGVKGVGKLEVNDLKIGSDVKEEKFLEAVPAFAGNFVNGKIKEREFWLKDGNLTLKGIVESQKEKAEAIALAAPLKSAGIKIIDQLKVEPPKMAAATSSEPKPISPPKPPSAMAMKSDTPPEPDDGQTKGGPIPVDPNKGELHSVYFGTGEFHIRSSQKDRARKLLARAKASSGKIIIDGFADERGDSKVNRFLSDERAQRIRSYLIANGIDPNRIVSVHGRGEVAGNRGQYQQYRRTDVRILGADE